MKLKYTFVTGVNRSGHTTLLNKALEDPGIPSPMFSDEHYMQPWDMDHGNKDMLRQKFLDRIDWLIEHTTQPEWFADFGHYWLKSIPWLVKQFDPQIHIIKRKKKDVVDSFMAKLDEHKLENVTEKFLITDNTAHNWSVTYPLCESDPKLSMEENYKKHISMFWTEYYKYADVMVDLYPDNVKLWKSEYLVEGDNYKKLF